jgi:AcrR family transcriptional regulator
MPRTEQQNQALREESRANILRHALILFAHHGYEQTTVRMIAQAAGVAQGLMYNYFDGKEQLLRALFEQSMADVRTSFAMAEAAEGIPPLEGLIAGAFALLRRNLDFWRLSYALRTQPAALESIGAELRSWTDAIRHTLEGYFHAQGNSAPQIEAAILFALIDGISQHYALDPERYPLDAVEAALIERYR